MRHTLLALTALVFATPAFAQSATIATPAGQWEASSDNGLCRMQRTFNADGAAHLLILEQNAPSHSFGMALAGPSLARLNSDVPLRLIFDADDPGFERKVVIEPNRQFGSVAIFRSVWLGAGRRLATGGDAVPDRGRIDLDLGRRADRIDLTQGDTRLSFATGSLAEAVEALNACTEPFLREWGLDPVVQYDLQRPARPAEWDKLAKQLRDAYPRAAVRSRRSGPMEAVALVDAAGTATECRIIVRSGHDDIDAAACQAMTKAQYLPALDADGKAVASFWKTRVNFAATAFGAQRIAP